MGIDPELPIGTVMASIEQAYEIVAKQGWLGRTPAAFRQQGSTERNCRT
jgi:hypothetical protein